MGKYDDRPYDVGKGKPPSAHQFKKGVSGNPKGPRRKKKALDASLPVLLQEALNELVPAFLNGRETQVPKKQVLMIQTINDALDAKPPERLKALKVLHAIGAFNPDVFDTRPDPELQQDAISDFIDTLIEEGKRDEATRPQFDEYEKRFDPERGREIYHSKRSY
jgi:hypothetical protein